MGRKQGEKIGIEKGTQERNLEIAKAMLKEGEPIEKVARFTGISASDIQKIP